MTGSGNVSFRSVLRLRPLIGSEHLEEENDILRLPEAAATKTFDDKICIDLDTHRTNSSLSDNESANSPTEDIKSTSENDIFSTPIKDPPSNLNSSQENCLSNSTVILKPPASSSSCSPHSGYASPWRGGKTRFGKINTAKSGKQTKAERFRFDSVLASDCSQQTVYESIGSGIVEGSISKLLNKEDNGIVNSSIKNGTTQSLSRTPENKDRPKSVNLQENWSTHVLFSLGVSNSGKSHTLYFPSSELNQSNKECSHKTTDGIIPRMIDDLFSSYQKLENNIQFQESKNVGSKRFLLEISMMEVHNERIYDMLTNSEFDMDVEDQSRACSNSNSNRKQPIISSKTQKKGGSSSSSSRQSTRQNKNRSTSRASPLRIHIHQDIESETFFVPGLVCVKCGTASHARRVLNIGLQTAKVSATSMNDTSSRSHTIINIQPILLEPDPEKEGKTRRILGGKIVIYDLAGIERIKKSAVKGTSMRESININASVGGVMTCLRALKRNQLYLDSGKCKQKPKVVPYRESKLTMLLQPVFSGKSGHARVTMLVSAYTGSKDYAEKRALLKEVDSLRGLKIASDSPGHWLKKSPRPKLASPLLKLPVTHVKKNICEFKALEEENKVLIMLNENLKRTVQDLLKSNASLQEKLTESCIRKKGDIRVEEQYVEERQVRLREQCLISTPLQEHIQNVQNTNNIRSEGFQTKSVKPPFQLTLPPSWMPTKNVDYSKKKSRKAVALNIGQDEDSSSISTKEEENAKCATPNKFLSTERGKRKKPRISTPE